MRYSKDLVKNVLKSYNNVIRQILDSTDKYAKSNQVTINGVKYIKATDFRMWLRQIRKEILDKLRKFEE